MGPEQPGPLELRKPRRQVQVHRLWEMSLVFWEGRGQNAGRTAAGKAGRPGRPAEVALYSGGRVKGRGAPQTLQAGVSGRPWRGGFGQELLKLRLDWRRPRGSPRPSQERGRPQRQRPLWGEDDLKFREATGTACPGRPARPTGAGAGVTLLRGRQSPGAPAGAWAVWCCLRLLSSAQTLFRDKKGPEDVGPSHLLEFLRDQQHGTDTSAPRSRGAPSEEPWEPEEKPRAGGVSSAIEFLVPLRRGDILVHKNPT